MSTTNSENNNEPLWTVDSSKSAIQVEAAVAAQQVPVSDTAVLILQQVPVSVAAGDDDPPAPLVGNTITETNITGGCPPSAKGQSADNDDNNDDNDENDKVVAQDGSDISSSFPQKLKEILANDAYAEIISWLPHGRGFIIHQKKRFASEVLPKFFKKSKFTSFTRKLNRWSFVRVTRGPETGAYYHPLFRRDEPALAAQMTCILSKAPQQVQSMNPIALGLAPGGQMPTYPGMIPLEVMDPTQMQWMQEQQQQQAYFLWQQQCASMYMQQQLQQQLQQPQSQQGNLQLEATATDGSTGHENRDVTSYSPESLQISPIAQQEQPNQHQNNDFSPFLLQQQQQLEHVSTGEPKG